MYVYKQGGKRKSNRERERETERGRTLVMVVQWCIYQTLTTLHYSIVVQATKHQQSSSDMLNVL